MASECEGLFGVPPSMRSLIAALIGLIALRLEQATKPDHGKDGCDKIGRCLTNPPAKGIHSQQEQEQ